MAKLIKRDDDGLGAEWTENVDFTGSVSVNGDEGLSVDLADSHVKLTHIKVVKGIVTELEAQ